MARPVFESMGQGRPGLIMAVIRTGLLTVPCGWGGMLVARSQGYPGLYGLMLGLLLVAGLSSVAFLAWLRRALPTGDEQGATP